MAQIKEYIQRKRSKKKLSAVGLYEEFSYQWKESLKGGGMVWIGFVRRGVKSFFGAKKKYLKGGRQIWRALWISGLKDERQGGIFIEKSIPFFGPFTVTQTSHSKTIISPSTNSKNIVWSALWVVVVVHGLQSSSCCEGSWRQFLTVR